MRVTNCSMGCMYATGPIGKCLCPCDGKSHGMMATNLSVSAKCSPAVAVRCKSGNEDGECKCACKGVNHGLYQVIKDFDSIKISGLQNVWDTKKN